MARYELASWLTAVQIPVVQISATLAERIVEASGRSFEELTAAGSAATLSALVRTEPRPSRATVWLRPPGELLEFLNRWHDAEG